MSETLVNGYHLLQLCGREPSETIAFSEFVNDLGEGYDDTLLFGADTGCREFALDFPTLGNFTADRTYQLDGVMLTAAEYLWELYCRQKVEGKPFVIKSARNNQYYLVKFKDPAMTQKKMLVAMFSGSSIFKQYRKSGVTVFDPSKLKLWGLFDADDFDTIDKVWTDSSGSGHDLARPSGGIDYVKVANAQNGQTVLRFNSAAGSSFLASGSAVNVKDAFIALKINEATFSNTNGIVSGGASDTNGILIGNTGLTKFYDLNYRAGQTYFYSKNGAEFAESNQQAPMNTFAVVYIRAETGIALNDLYIGKDRNTAHYGKMDIGEMAFSSSLLPKSQVREMLEYLFTKYGI